MSGGDRPGQGNPEDIPGYIVRARIAAVRLQVVGGKTYVAGDAGTIVAVNATPDRLWLRAYFPTEPNIQAILNSATPKIALGTTTYVAAARPESDGSFSIELPEAPGDRIVMVSVQSEAQHESGPANEVYASPVRPERERPLLASAGAGDPFEPLYRNRFGVSEWGDPMLVTTGDSGFARARIGLDAQGKGVAAYTLEETPSQLNWPLYASVFDGTSWGGKRELGPEVERKNFALAVAENGTAVVAWVANASAGGSEVRAAVYTPLTGWGESVLVGPAQSEATVINRIALSARMVAPFGEGGGGPVAAALAWVEISPNETRLEFRHCKPCSSTSSFNAVGGTPTIVSGTGAVDALGSPTTHVFPSGDYAVTWATGNVGFGNVGARRFVHQTGTWNGAVHLLSLDPNLFTDAVGYDACHADEGNLHFAILDSVSWNVSNPKRLFSVRLKPDDTLDSLAEVGSVVSDRFTLAFTATTRAGGLRSFGSAGDRAGFPKRWPGAWSTERRRVTKRA